MRLRDWCMVAGVGVVLGAVVTARSVESAVFCSKKSGVVTLRPTAAWAP